MVVLDMSWLVFMYAVKKKKRIYPEPWRSISGVACASFWLVENYGHVLVEKFVVIVWITTIKNIFVKLLCVPKRKGTGNQRPYVIMWRPYLHFRFWYNMSITLGSLCKKILSNSFEETVLWLWTLKEKKVNKNKNLELLLNATYF